MTATGETKQHKCIVPDCNNMTDGLQCESCRTGGRSAVWPGIPGVCVSGDRPAPASARPSGAPTTSDDPCDAGVLEESVARDCDIEFGRRGWRLWRIGISEAGRVFQTPGVPDRLVVNGDETFWAWVEYKRPVGGRQSPAQKDFQRVFETLGCRYYLVSKVEHLDRIFADAEAAVVDFDP